MVYEVCKLIKVGVPAFVGLDLLTLSAPPVVEPIRQLLCDLGNGSDVVEGAKIRHVLGRSLALTYEIREASEGYCLVYLGPGLQLGPKGFRDDKLISEALLKDVLGFPVPFFVPR